MRSAGRSPPPWAGCPQPGSGGAGRPRGRGHGHGHAGQQSGFHPRCGRCAAQPGAGPPPGGYLLELEQAELPTARCRPVLLALSAGDQRRQRDLDAGGHLLACSWCARPSEPLLDRGRTAAVAGEVRIPIGSDADVVTARKQGRELAAQAGFSATELTIIATAISEIARNIVMFAEREIVVSLVGENSRQGGPWSLGTWAGHPGPGAGPSGRLQRLRGDGAWPAGLAAADGRVRDHIGGRQGNHRHHDEMATRRVMVA